MKKKTLLTIIVCLAVTAFLTAAGYGLYRTVYKSAKLLKDEILLEEATGKKRPTPYASNNGAGVAGNSNTVGNNQGTGTEQGSSDTSENAGNIDGSENARSEFENKLNAILAYIDYYYYDEVDVDKIYDDMLHAAVYSLGDVYSTYYSPEEMEALMESTSGVYSGIGATISQSYDTMEMTIVTPFAGSPADEAGVLPGDQIVAVNGEDVIGEDLNNVVAIIKGPEGTDVTVTMLRDGERIDITMTRRSINVEFVSHRMLDDKVGYILVSEFEETTAEQFDEAIKDLTSQGMQGLVVDLRGNPGGLYDIVCEMLDRILPKDSTLVYTVDKYNHTEYQYAQTKQTLDIPIAVLIDGNSASASEIFAGALQDNNAATIVGTQSFGKGIVQSVMYITNDYAGIKLTSSRYYTPKGVCIHGVGITPDVEVQLEEGLEKVLIERRDHDNQIDAAADIVRSEIKKR